VDVVPLGVVGGVSLMAVRDFVNSCLPGVRTDFEGKGNAKEARGGVATSDESKLDRGIKADSVLFSGAKATWISKCHKPVVSRAVCQVFFYR